MQSVTTTQDAIERSGHTMPAFDDWDEWARIDAREEARQEITAAMAVEGPSREELDAEDAADRPVHRSNPTGRQTARHDMPSEKQMKFARDLRAKRDPEFKVVPSILRPTKRQMSQLIDALKALPVIAASTRARRETVIENARPTPIGTFTIVRGDGSYRTLQIGPAKWAEGKIVASYLSGPDNELSYTSFAFIFDGVVKPFNRFRSESELLEDLKWFLTSDSDEAHERFLDEAERYALRSERCMRCGHKLTVPTSLHRGLGPVCAAIEGI